MASEGLGAVHAGGCTHTLAPSTHSARSKVSRPEQALEVIDNARSPNGPPPPCSLPGPNSRVGDAAVELCIAHRQVAESRRGQVLPNKVDWQGDQGHAKRAANIRPGETALLVGATNVDSAVYVSCYLMSQILPRFQ